MIRNLRVLTAAAAMALASLGAMAASARAAGEQFHCSVEPCRVTARNDGTGKTGHQVFVVKDSIGREASFTCTTVTAEARSSTSTSGALLFENIAYGEGNPEHCTINGSPGITVHMNGCTYEFTAEGGGAAPGAEIHLACTGGEEIEIVIPGGGCTFTIAGGQRLKGARYHNIGAAANTTTEVTVENNEIKGLAVTISPGGTLAACHVDPALTLTSELRTGNLIATGETDPGGVMSNAWWA